MNRRDSRLSWQFAQKPHLALMLLLLSITPFASFACDSEEYRQFDFWIGKWEVTTPDGKLAGENEITQVFGDCVLTERYSTPTGFEGSSFNIFDKTTGQWHQTWVDNTGLLLQLDGGLVDKRMVLWGDGLNQSGQLVTHRITWTPNEDSSVRQHWQISNDQGISWQTLFDGLYKRQE